MGCRLLVDENVETEVAVFLRNRGHQAEHVQEGIGKGTTDLDITSYALENDLAFVNAQITPSDPLGVGRHCAATIGRRKVLYR